MKASSTTMKVEVPLVYYEIACGGGVSTFSSTTSSSNSFKIVTPVASGTQTNKWNNNSVQACPALSGEITTDNKVDDISDN